MTLEADETGGADSAARGVRRRSPMRRALVLVAGFAVLLAPAALGVRLTGLAESQFFYVPSRKAFQTPAGIEDVTITTPDGLKLSAWYLPPADRKPTDAPAPAVLFCHGNAGDLPNHLSYVQFLGARGIGVLMFDYRSYGRSDKGRLVRENLAIDSEAALATLKSRKDVDPARVGVYGFSLGGAFALELAARHAEIKSVCTAAAFSSWGAVAGDRVPLLGPLLVGTGVDGDTLAASLGTRPFLIVHGEADRIVDVRHSEVLERAGAKGGAQVQRMAIAGGDHSRLLLQHPEAAAAIGDFFARTLGATGTRAAGR